MLQTSHIIWNVINLIALFWLINRFLGKTIGNAIKNKQDATAKSISDVENKLNEITKKLQSQEAQLNEVKKEIQKIEDQAVSMAQKLREDIIKSAHEEAEKLREQIKKSMEQDINRTKAELKNDLVTKALSKAEELMAERLNKETQVNLIKNFAVSLGSESSKN